jgi:hypothetical protein
MLTEEKDEFKLKYVDTLWQYRSYIHMRKRLKDDQISY